MLKRFGLEASRPAISGGGRWGFPEAATNFPFADGGKDFKTRCYGGVKSFVMSSSEETYYMRLKDKLHGSMASSKQFSRHEVEECKNMKSSQPSSRGDDDAFGELGPLLSNSTDSGIELSKLNDKDSKPPRTFATNESQRSNKTSLRHLIPEKMTSMRGHLNQDNRPPVTDFNLENHSSFRTARFEAWKRKWVAENSKYHSISLSISIDEVPPNISLQDLREAVSLYGEILKISMRIGQDGIKSCHVQFNAMESKEKALSSGRITVRDCQLPVRGVHMPEYIKVRIKNISMETAETAIHSMCSLCGDVNGLARTREGAVDVLFRARDNLTAQSIVKQLNDVFLDDCQWKAQLLPNFSQNSRTNASGSQRAVASQITSVIGSFRKQLQMQRIYLEDLEDLHHAVLHLRDRPPERST